MRQKSPKKSPEVAQLLHNGPQEASPITSDAKSNVYQRIANSGPKNQKIAQLKDIANGSAESGSRSSSTGGLPTQLKQGVESLSGISMDGVKVHYNSDKPAQLKAEAYAQGSEIHLAPGKEQHLPHEAWHVVQQAQGRVKPTLQMKRGVAINDDAGLEREADEKGAEAMRLGGGAKGPLSSPSMDNGRQPLQLKGGRRTVIDPEGKLTFLKLVLPGSGYEHWPTHTKSEKDAMKPLFDKADAAPQLHWKRPSDDKWQVTIAGPMGKGGASDTGANRIEENVKKGYQLLHEQIISLALSHHTDASQIVVLIKAHSRNAVAATRIANELAKTWAKKGLQIELAAHDPVPGPGHSGEDEEITLHESINSTVVYSMFSGYQYGFKPQIVKGAKRMILSLQKHGAGLVQHFSYSGKTYKGSNLNSLDQGLYLSKGKSYTIVEDSKGNETITKARSLEEINQFFKDNPAGWTETERRYLIKLLAIRFGIRMPSTTVESSSADDEKYAE